MRRRTFARILGAAAAGLLATSPVMAVDWSPTLWTTATLSQARSGVTATTVGTKAFFAGGNSGTSANLTPSNVVDVYDSAVNSWSTLTLSQARSDMSATSSGSKAYFGAGIVKGADSKLVDIYDTATATWSTANLFQAREQLAAAAANGKVLFGRGVATTSNVDIYDTASNAWSTAALSHPRYGLAATTSGNKVYFGGGAPLLDSSSTGVVDIYDTTSNTWSTSTLPNSTREELSAGSAAGKVVFAGGWGGITPSNAVDIFDTTTNTWLTSPPMATLSVARYLSSSASLGNQIFFGGGIAAAGVTNAVDIYDASTNTWHTKTLSVARSYLAATAVGNKVIFAGGTTDTAASNVVDIYNAQIYPTITSTQNFVLVDNTIVNGLMNLPTVGNQLSCPFNLSVGSMTGTEPIVMVGTRLTVGSDNTNCTYTGQITGNGSSTLVKVGMGAVTLATNSMPGGVTINQGKLVLNGALATTPITVSGGGALGMVGSSDRTLVFAGGALAALRGILDQVDGVPRTLVLSDTQLGQNALTLGGTTAGAASDMEFELGATPDSIQIPTDKLLVNAGGAIINITELPGSTPGTYNLITFGSGRATGLANFTLGTTTLPSGLHLALQSTSTAEQLVVTAPEPGAVVGVGAGLFAIRRRSRSRS